MTQIVKIQISQASSDGEQYTLIYNEDRSFMCEWGHVPESLKEMMDGRPKAFFNAKAEDGAVAILDEAEWQEW